MKILYIDQLCPRGHLKFNKQTIDKLSTFCDVDVVFSEDYFTIEDINGLRVNKWINYPNDWSLYRHSFDARIKQIKVLKFANQIVLNNRYDAVIFSSFDTISFSSFNFLFKMRKTPIYLIHHNNIDALSKSGIKRLIFRTYSNKVNHVVLEKFISQFLISKINVPSHKTFVVRHPIDKHMKSSIAKGKDNLAIALSNSNDENIIETLIDIEKRERCLEEIGCKVILKSKKIIHKSATIETINGFIENSEYEQYYKKAKFILLPFKDSFNYRISGSLLEALSKGKVVIGNNSVMMQHYSHNYPYLCKCVNNTKDFLCLLKGTYDEDEIDKDFKRFINDYSDMVIIKMWESTLHSNIS
jgi:glycosyltransferase involved in cell wall biosynthesis